MIIILSVSTTPWEASIRWPPLVGLYAAKLAMLNNLIANCYSFTGKQHVLDETCVQGYI